MPSMAERSGSSRLLLVSKEAPLSSLGRATYSLLGIVPSARKKAPSPQRTRALGGFVAVRIRRALLAVKQATGTAGAQERQAQLRPDDHAGWLAGGGGIVDEYRELMPRNRLGAPGIGVGCPCGVTHPPGGFSSKRRRRDELSQRYSKRRVAAPASCVWPRKTQHLPMIREL
jgi:hypothetical protein